MLTSLETTLDKGSDGHIERVVSSLNEGSCPLVPNEAHLSFFVSNLHSHTFTEEQTDTLQAGLQARG